VTVEPILVDAGDGCRERDRKKRSAVVKRPARAILETMDDPRRFFVIAAVVGGVAFLIVTPPFQVPDEPAHFYQAYLLSEGRLRTVQQGNAPGASLPSSLRRLTELMVGDVPFNPDARIAEGASRRARALRLEPDRLEHITFPKAIRYSPLPYLPQAVGLAVGRWLGASPYELVHWARASNLLVSIALILLALHQLPGYRWFAVLVALTPMAMFLRSSMSADATTTGIAFVLAATIAKLAVGPSAHATRRDLLVLVGASAALCLTKPVYFPLLLAVLAIPSHRLPAVRRGTLAVLILIIVVGAVAAAYAIALPSLRAVSLDTSIRIEKVLFEPLEFLELLVGGYVTNAARFGAQFVGRLGWMDTALPAPLIILYALFLVGFAIFESDRTVRVTRGQRLIFLGATIASLAVLGTAIYVLGGRLILLQGRYFHPIALTAVWVVANHRWPRLLSGHRASIAAAALTLVSFALALWTIEQRYFGG
jgi:hypothetical protein